MFHAKVKASKQLPMLRQMFPTYKGRTVYLCDGETAHISDYWDEGSRAYPRLFRLGLWTNVPLDETTGFVQQNQGNPFNLSIGTVTLRPGVALAEHVFSGTHQYLRVTLHPSDDRSEWIL